MTDQTSDADLRCPVTLLTGFLGAGKTTLLNTILNDAEGPNIAVVVNEFGEAGLDHDLIEAVDEEVVLMQSGCLCCSIRGDLSTTLHGLLNRQRRGEIRFDRVVIETTGLADPGPIIQTLLVDAYLAHNVRLDGVVTVVDAAMGPDTLDRQFEAVSQVAMADLLVLSKTDLAAQNSRTAFEARLRDINPTAPILQSTQKGVPLDALWGLSGMSRQSQPETVMAWLTPPTPTQTVDPFTNLSGFGSIETTAPLPSGHDARIGSASIVVNEPISVEAFDLWLDTLVMLKGPNILRVKGIVHLIDIEAPFVFHGVQHLFDPPVPMPHWPGGDRKSRIVVIARDMTNPELVRSLEMLQAHQDATLETTSGA